MWMRFHFTYLMSVPILLLCVLPKVVCAYFRFSVRELRALCVLFSCSMCTSHVFGVHFFFLFVCVYFQCCVYFTGLVIFTFYFVCLYNFHMYVCTPPTVYLLVFCVTWSLYFSVRMRCDVENKVNTVKLIALNIFCILGIF
jgi:hypothetical protein